MRISTPHRTVLTAAAVLLAVPGTAAAASADGRHPADGLLPVAALAADRLATADLVAAAKWGTDSPIDDPAREQQVLDTVAAQAQQIGADPDEMRRVFRDQIEANKLVQRALFAEWTAHPDRAPTTKPDLSVVRATINRINTDLVRSLADTTPERVSPSCGPELLVAAVEVHHEKHQDLLHTTALARSLAHICRD
ncbi:chorismate mutase [Streptomyces panaciradicis]|uniref:chorismate mutase n=1 Tax=Streptomyces panaciradicis TaxID=1470261 RepID=UPI00201D2C4B|nr:chorismate mutase [Streptomyces panaciradicis]MCL6668849.1 chorismate mutase [Streptomyces panaciradicis]